jgi:hypothetical protein
MRIAFVEQFLERLGNRTGTNLHDRRADCGLVCEYGGLALIKPAVIARRTL